MNLIFDKKRDWFIPVLGLLLVFILAARTPVDPDMWWHLKAGEVSWTNLHPLLSDPFSFTRYGEAWINHSWLSQVGMYLLFSFGGFLALGGGMALLATASMGLVYLQMEGPAILKAFLLILGSIVAAVVWSVRPQLVSLVLLSIVAVILFFYKCRQKNYIKWLPLVFLLWANLHGGYPLGFLLIGAMITGELINHLLRDTSNTTLSWQQLKQLIGWSLASVLALLINANGLNIWKIPFQTVEVSALQQFISEWASPDFHELYQQPYLWLLFAVLAAVGLSRKRIDGTDLVSIILFAYMGLVARRNFGPFAIIALPVLSRHLWAAIQSWGKRPGLEPVQADEPSTVLPRRRPRWQRRLNLVIVGMLALVAFGKLYIVTSPGFVQTATVTTEPVAAIDWMLENNLHGRVFNEYNWGGYLIWRTQELPVFVDGRTDLFGDQIMGEWLTIVQAGEGWRENLDQWRVDFVLVDPGRPLAKALPEAGWKMLYSDTQAVLFTR
jgi:hypothetical protein